LLQRARDAVPASTEASYCSALSPHASATDLNREAAKRGIKVHEVRVEVTGTFGNPGEPARDIRDCVQVQADAPKTTMDDLIRATDAVTEIQNTLRAGCAVRLEPA